VSDTKISALTAAGAAAGANEIPINEAGTSKKLTVTQIQAYTFGAAFPTGAALTAYGNNHPFFRTDLGESYYYDGTRWVSAYEESVTLKITASQEGGASTIELLAPLDSWGFGLWCTRAEALIYTGGNNGGNYLTYQLASRTAAGVGHNLGSSFTTAADTQATFVSHPIAIGAVVTAGDTHFYLAPSAVTGSPTGRSAWCQVFYRKIAT
jgi:hypothetical protein